MRLVKILTILFVMGNFMTLPISALAVVPSGQALIGGKPGATYTIKISLQPVQEVEADDDGKIAFIIPSKFADQAKNREMGIPNYNIRDYDIQVIGPDKKSFFFNVNSDGELVAVSFATLSAKRKRARFYVAVSGANAWFDDLEESVGAAQDEAVAEGFAVQSSADSNAIGWGVKVGMEYEYSQNSQRFIDVGISYLDGFEMDGKLNATASTPDGTVSVDSNGSQEISGIIGGMSHYWPLTDKLFLGVGIEIGRFEFKDKSHSTLLIDGVPTETNSDTTKKKDTAAVLNVGTKYYFMKNASVYGGIRSTLDKVGVQDEFLVIYEVGVQKRF